MLWNLPRRLGIGRYLANLSAALNELSTAAGSVEGPVIALALYGTRPGAHRNSTSESGPECRSLKLTRDVSVRSLKLTRDVSVRSLKLTRDVSVRSHRSAANPQNAIAISPAVRSTIGIPLKEVGMSLYSMRSLRPASITIAMAKPRAVAKPFTTDSTKP